MSLPPVMFMLLPESRRKVPALTLALVRLAFRFMSPVDPVEPICSVPPATEICWISAGDRSSWPVLPAVMLMVRLVAFGLSITVFAAVPALTAPIIAISSAVSVTDAPPAVPPPLVVSMLPLSVISAPAPVVVTLTLPPLVVIAPSEIGAAVVTKILPTAPPVVVA